MVAQTDHTLSIGSAIFLEQLELPISLQCSGVGSGVSLAPPITEGSCQPIFLPAHVKLDNLHP